MQEVWTGKGLVTWALEEPGDGKNLITGRLIRSRDFVQVVRGQNMSALEAIMTANTEGSESWGIEISLGLQSGTGAQVGIYPQVQQFMSMTKGRNDLFHRSSVANEGASTSSAGRSHLEHPKHPVALPLRPIHQRVDLPTVKLQGPRPLSPTRMVSTAPQTTGREVNKRHSSGKRKKALNPHFEQPRPTANDRARSVDRKGVVKPRLDQASSSRNACGSNDCSQESNSEAFPSELPAQLYTNPETLTKEQAERLIESPAFLSMLEKLTGHPIEAVRSLKRGRDGEATDNEVVKKVKLEAALQVAPTPCAKAPLADPQTVLKCWNCGRTKSAVWRMKVMDDGKSVRVCNGKSSVVPRAGSLICSAACGLYWNKLRQMRPPKLWSGVDDDVKNQVNRDKKTMSVTPCKPAPRIDTSSGLKRTLSTVVEQDAKRIASLRVRSSGKSSLNRSSTPRPLTSPPRGSNSASRSVRNARWNVLAQAGASSPLGWAEPMQPIFPQSDSFDPVNESPNTAIRRILGSDMTLQSLELPLSDDGTILRPTDRTSFNWDPDLSDFFDVERFSLDADPAQGRPPAPQTTDFHRALPSGARRRREGIPTEDDDVLSQLFNRTSSNGNLESSPAPFDFSQLPPSSPPMMPTDLPHSALLLSSPDNSPMEFSPLDRYQRISPDKKSRLHFSFTPSAKKTNLQSRENNQGNYDSFHELLGKFQDGDGSMVSSVGAAEGLLGDEDLFALLNSS